MSDPIFVFSLSAGLLGGMIAFGSVAGPDEEPSLDHLRDEPDEGSPHTIHGPDR